jgi:hypothetical protein
LSSVTAKDLDVFRGIVGNTGVKTEDLDSYNTDWLHTHTGLHPLPSLAIPAIHCIHWSTKRTLRGSVDAEEHSGGVVSNVLLE